jgi:UPF0755 protein
MNDILPPKRPLSRPSAPAQESPIVPSPSSEPLSSAPSSPPVVPSSGQKRPRKRLWWGIAGGSILLVMLIGAATTWYTWAVRPANAGDTGRVRIEIASGTSPKAIGAALEDKKLIRSQLAFDIYTRLSGARGKLQAGTYSLSPSESLEIIVNHIVAGTIDQFSLTFLPGATLAENRKVLIKAGYTPAAVDAALAKTYDSSLFVGKPAKADLEGYIYGETYTFGSSATPEEVLARTFDEFYGIVKKEKLVEAFKKQGLTLYQGITLASIIQREVPDPKDQKQVAQIFLKRYRENMLLGSDVTAYYGADKKGVERSVAVDTPYNTRIHKGLPPGPIGTPGLTALQAVAHPAKGEYLYFLSGDDDVTYYAHNAQEHEANIRDHCKVKCATP